MKLVTTTLVTAIVFASGSAAAANMVVKNYSNRIACVATLSKHYPRVTTGWYVLPVGHVRTFTDVTAIYAEECNNRFYTWDPGVQSPGNLCVAQGRNFTIGSPDSDAWCVYHERGTMVPFYAVPEATPALVWTLTN